MYLLQERNSVEPPSRCRWQPLNEISVVGEDEDEAVAAAAAVEWVVEAALEDEVEGVVVVAAMVVLVIAAIEGAAEVVEVGISLRFVKHCLNRCVFRFWRPGW